MNSQYNNIHHMNCAPTIVTGYRTCGTLYRMDPTIELLDSMIAFVESPVFPRTVTKVYLRNWLQELLEMSREIPGKSQEKSQEKFQVK